MKTLLSTKRCTEQEGLRLLHAVTWRNPRNRIRSENKHIAKDCFPYGDIFSLDPEPSEAKQRSIQETRAYVIKLPFYLL